MPSSGAGNSEHSDGTCGRDVGIHGRLVQELPSRGLNHSTGGGVGGIHGRLLQEFGKKSP